MVDEAAAMRAGSGPSISKDIASKAAVIPEPKPSDFSVTWAQEGQMVALWHGAKIICMITKESRLGYSRALAKVSVLGLPFDDAIAVKSFRQSPTSQTP
jgi:hypothetical protein